MGAIGAWVRGIHSGEARTQKYQRIRVGWTPRLLLMRLSRDHYEAIMGLLLGILLELLGILLILPDLLVFYYISNTIGKTIGNIS